MKTTTSRQKYIWTEVEMNSFLDLVKETLNIQRCIASLIEPVKA